MISETAVMTRNILPDYPEGNFTGSYASKDNCIMYMYTNTSLAGFEQYLVQLSEKGFTCHDKHIMADNYHATYYIEDKQLIQVYYTACDQTTRIILDTNTNLYTRCKDIRHDESTDEQQTILYQLLIDYTFINCGMCYIVKCSDGSFFIIDSAHRLSADFHIVLHDFLRSLTPEGKKIIISGWFFSHAHQDHIDKFMDFLKADFNDYIIECLYYNFPSLTTAGSENWKPDDKATMLDFDILINKHKEIPVIKLHTGQRFFIRNLEFEVLATHEDIYPHDLAKFNDSSIVIIMTVCGCKTLFLGDANIVESNILVSRYGTYLKSDIVQISHHGYNGATVEVYENANAKTALFPVDQKNFHANLYREPNQKALAICVEYFVCGNSTVALSMPYKPRNAIFL